MRNKIVLLMVTLLAFSTIKAQYNKPNAVSYEAKTKSYYVLNNGNGSITKLDSFFNTSQVITGLYDPQDLLFADLGTNKVLLVLDSMQIKVFDQASNSLMLSIAVPGAVHLRSGVLDLSNPNVFYLSDDSTGKIYKGSVGAAPFYQVTFSTLATGIDKPSGMLFDSKNRLIVVTDTIDSRILQVNTTSGKIDTILATSLGFLHSIREDAQGNYFVTSHGDSYLYRFNSSFTGVAKLTGYNKPSGFYINTDQDLMVLACTGCGKIYFNLLHLMATNSVSKICPGDSFTLSMNISYNGIGTYGAGNVFYVEISDSMGSFANPMVVGTWADIIVPAKFSGKLPNRKYGNNHLIRVRATQPKYASSSATITPNEVPEAIAANSDIVSACPNQKIILGSTNQNGINYKWMGPNLLSDSTISAPFFISSKGGDFTYYLETRNGVGCLNYDTVTIEVANELKITGVPDTIKLCIGDTVLVGQANLDYVFNWTPSSIINSATTSQVRAFPTSDVRLTVSFTDTSVGCSGRDSVEIRVFARPSASEINLADTAIGCEGKILTIAANVLSNMNYIWSNSNDLFLGDKATLAYSNSVNSEFVRLLVQNSLADNCRLHDSIWVNINANPTKPAIIKIDNVLSSSETAIKYQWYLNGVAVPSSDKKQLTITSADNGFYQVEVFTKDCSSISDSISTNVGVFKVDASDAIKSYPLPFSNQLNIKAINTIATIELYSLNGVLILNELAQNDLVVLNTAGLNAGVYTLKVILTDGTVAYQKVMKAWK
jgi:hypothetical protein